ncbi:helix-turn-helix domain-containing protein [bacterium]|nr:MAG: helix-turn-helix domain-containing protein [bacterium]
MPEAYETTASDPRRGVRRHHYQEGPGFLFLATQNGRPTMEHQAGPGLEGVRRRMRTVKRALEAGVETASRESGVPRRSLYRWMVRYQETGIDGLVNRSRSPLQLRPTIPACDPTSSGTSTSRVRSSSTSAAGVTSRPGSLAWSTTIRAS